MLRFGILLFSAIDMTVNICNRNVLCGYQAAKALDKYIQGLEKGKVEGLTKKQVYSLIKTAKVLRTAVVQFESC
jgi:hypothetical protein